MATNFLKWGLVIGGGYLAYKSGLLNSLLASFGGASSPAPAAGAPAPTGGGGGTPTGSGATAAPPYAYTAPDLTHQLQSAAGATITKYNADQWRFLYERLPGRSPLAEPIFMALFFPQGRPANPDDAPTFTAAEFAAAITSKGLSGLGSSAFDRGSRLPHETVAAIRHQAARGDLLAAIYLVKLTGERPPIPTGGGGRMSLAGIPLSAFRI